MNHKFRKKPVVIEAFQMTKERRQDNRDWPEWLNRAWNEETGAVGCVWCRDYPNSDGTDPLVIGTKEGVMVCGLIVVLWSLLTFLSRSKP